MQKRKKKMKSNQMKKMKRRRSPNLKELDDRTLLILEWKIFMKRSRNSAKAKLI
jgi:hypothetical protein